LYQNYPNPFNLSTIIAFQLPISRVVTLSIYDITGKEVMRLIENQRFAPGVHQVVWNGLNQNGKEVSSGIYLYELTAGSFREVKKMLFIQ
jgi:flagellar hook assembly protein FlgD